MKIAAALGFTYVAALAIRLRWWVAAKVLKDPEALKL